MSLERPRNSLGFLLAKLLCYLNVVREATGDVDISNGYRPEPNAPRVIGQVALLKQKHSGIGGN